MSESKENSNAVLSKSTLYAHGSIGIPLAVIGYPLAIWIPAHYAGGLGLSLAMVGTILMLARFTDVLTDPIMGEISDRWRTRFGRRRPWLLVGMPIMMLGVYKLFIPPADVGIWYFLIYLTLFFVGSTIIALPHRAWGAELSTDYHQRSRVTASREFFVLGGLMLAALVPMLVEVTADGSGSVGQVFTIIWQDAVGAFTGDLADKEIVNRSTLTGPVLAGLAWTIILVLPVCVFVVLAFVKEPPPTKKDTVPLKEGLRYLWKNGPMRRVLIIALLVVFGEAFRNAVSLFFIRDIIGIPTIGAAYFFYFIAGLGAIPFWLWLGRKIGKHRAFMCTLITISAVSFANLFLSYGDYLAFFLLFIVKGFCFGAFAYLPRAMLADAIDLDTLRSGAARPASYFAILGFITKCAASFGGLSLPILAIVGYSASAGAINGPDELFWLGVLYGVIPTSVFVVAFYLCSTWPLTDKLHEKVVRLVEKRYNKQIDKAAQTNE